MAFLLGAECKKEFYLEEGFTFVNHGSFGCVPRSIFEARMKRIQELEQNPDTWFRYKYYPLMKEGLKVMSDFLNCALDELVFVENATTGVAIALHSLKLKQGEGLMVTTLTYEAVRFTADRLCKELSATHHILDLNPPYKDKAEVIERYRTYLSAHPDVRVTVVDHITSPSSILFPVKEIVKVCHEYGVTVIVDGAHAPGQLELDLTDIGAEYYTGNLHKWMFCPRGCAIFYIRPDMRDITKPLLASSRYLDGYPYEFYVQGTRDGTPYCVVPEVFKFYQDIGGLASITGYCAPLVQWAANMLAEKLGEYRIAVPDDMCSPCMAIVHLPAELQGTKTKEYANHVAKVLGHHYKVMIAIEPMNGELWLRISCQIYNTKEDYERVAKALLDLKENPDKLSL